MLSTILFSLANDEFYGLGKLVACCAGEGQRHFKHHMPKESRR